ncbi:exodeoxyribonuclease VII small subunit [Arachnia propionica]|uniref:Exodeoxyribonuclease VII small subunit n=1 Tax=Arachnia propionica TaxID=1750 RepID=A0A3P1WT41_9ACTN|nr:exodeoxyribonuclease VII small subunit [Arachnia propionica]RRD49166.1 exodeoxyribonuclease VII small subunit [Arachnia propionica]
MSETPSYETARDELAATVAQLESGGTTLAETMTLWKRGEELAAICQAHLDAARAAVDEARQES